MAQDVIIACKEEIRENLKKMSAKLSQLKVSL